MAELGPRVEEEREITSPENNNENTSKQVRALAVICNVYMWGSVTQWCIEAEWHLMPSSGLFKSTTTASAYKIKTDPAQFMRLRTAAPLPWSGAGVQFDAISYIAPPPHPSNKWSKAVLTHTSSLTIQFLKIRQMTVPHHVCILRALTNRVHCGLTCNNRKWKSLSHYMNRRSCTYIVENNPI